MSDLYRENIIDHYRNPRNTKTLTSATHIGASENLSCGDEITLQLKINSDTGRIVEVSHETIGCAICTASMSMLSEMLLEKKLDEAKNISYNDLLNELGIELSPAREKCALVSLEAIKNARKM